MIDDLTLASEFRHLAALGSRIEDRQMRTKGVSLAQSRLLEIILHTPRARWSDIAAALGYSPRTITEALDALERSGLITRSPDPADRRSRILELTRKGTVDLAGAQAVRDEVRAVLFGVLTDDEKGMLLELFQRMRNAVAAIDIDKPLGLPN